MKAILFLALLFLFTIADGIDCKIACDGNGPTAGCPRDIIKDDSHSTNILIKRRISFGSNLKANTLIKRSPSGGLDVLNNGSGQPYNGPNRTIKKGSGPPKFASNGSHLSSHTEPDPDRTPNLNANQNAIKSHRAEPDPDRRTPTLNASKVSFIKHKARQT